MKKLTRKSIESPDGLFTSDIGSLLENAQLLHDKPERFNKNFVKYLEELLEEAEKILIIVRNEIELAKKNPLIKKAPKAHPYKRIWEKKEAI